MATTTANRSPLIVQPHLYMGDVTGRPLDYGMVYFGEPNKDPEFYPINIYYDKDLTQQATQPVRTKGGFLNANGDIVEIFALEGTYSVKVLDQYGRKIFYKGEVAKQTIGDATSDIVDAAQVEINKRMAQLDDAINTAVSAGAGANGWTDQLILLSNGRTQKQKNQELVTPFDFGAIGDGVYHKLSEKYATLADAKKKYPTAQSLDDSVDLCALEAFFDHCHDNLVNANITLNAYVNRPLYVGMIRTNAEFKTTVFDGNLTLTNTQATSEIPFLARINVRAATFTGKLSFIGNGSGNVKDRKQLGGLVIGDNGTDGSAGRTHINSVTCNNFKNFGVFISNDAIFPRIDNVHCGWIGAIGKDYTDSTTSHTATITAKTDVDAAYDQYSLLTVTSLPDAKDNDVNILGAMVMFEGDPLLYRVTSTDVTNSQIKVYPRLDKNKTYSKLSYIYGTGLGWSGNNSGAGNFGHLQFIVCGIGFWGGSLYGGNINYLSTEYCGVGLTLGKPWEVVIGYNIDNAYFETNTWDYIQQWANNYSPLVNINMAHGLDMARVGELFSYRVSAWNDSRGQNNFNKSSITLGHRKYEIKDTYYDWVDLSDPQDFINVMNSGFDLTLTYSNIDINDKFNMRAKTLVIAQNYEPWRTPKAITIKVPEGWYLNGVLNGTLTTNPQKFATVLTVVRSATDNYSTKSLYVYGDSLYKTSGLTAERPSNAPTGFVYIDTTLNKPIYKTNSGWVDATGAAV